MSWGTDLWDQFENLDKHTLWGIDFLERYSKFVKDRMEIEQMYAKQLRNLVKKYCPKRPKDEEPRLSACLSFFTVLNELNDYAGQREVVAEEMGHQVYGELLRYSQDLKAERKHHLQEGRKTQQYLEQCWKQMDISKKKFERECREAEKSQLTYERLESDPNATKTEVEKAKSQHYLRVHSADESKNEYAAQLQHFNREQNKHYHAALPQIFKNLQCMDERRSLKLGESYTNLAEVERRVIPIISKCLEGMVTAGKSVDEKKDSLIVVETFKSGFEPPGDVPFEDFSQSMQRTGSDSTISTPKSEAVKTDPKNTIGKAKNKLWLFGKKPKVPTLEDFSHLPPEQRRKRLQQRIDDLSKELQREVDQKDALSKMKDVYEKNPQMGDPASLLPKISETVSNMERLRSEIEKNESWLSQVEVKQAVRAERGPGTEVTNSSHGRESPVGRHVENNRDPRRIPETAPHEFDDFDDEDFLPPLGNCKALYSFDGQSEGSLVMREGEFLDIIEEDQGDGWTRARKQSGEEGYVPTSYLEINLQ